MSNDSRCALFCFFAPSLFISLFYVILLVNRDSFSFSEIFFILLLPCLSLVRLHISIPRLLFVLRPLFFGLCALVLIQALFSQSSPVLLLSSLYWDSSSAIMAYGRSPGFWGPAISGSFSILFLVLQKYIYGYPRDIKLYYCLFFLSCFLLQAKSALILLVLFIVFDQYPIYFDIKRISVRLRRIRYILFPIIVIIVFCLFTTFLLSSDLLEETSFIGISSLLARFSKYSFIFSAYEESTFHALFGLGSHYLARPDNDFLLLLSYYGFFGVFVFYLSVFYIYLARYAAFIPIQHFFLLVFSGFINPTLLVVNDSVLCLPLLYSSTPSRFLSHVERPSFL